MKKTTFIITIILLISLMFTACGSKSNEAVAPEPEVDESGYLDAGESDFSELDRMLTEIPELLYADFDYNESTSEDVIELMIPGYSADGYEFFFGELDVLSSPQDPKGNFDYGYYKVFEDDMNWIISDIFNIESSSELDSDMVYCKDGYYYIAAGDAGLITYEPEIKDYNQLKDGTYEITVECTSDDYESEDIQIVAGLKIVKGIRQWTFLEIDGIEFDGEDYAELDEDEMMDDDYYGIEDENEVSDVVEELAGSWWDVYSSRCGMDITYDFASDSFNIEIKWANSADEISVWELTGKYSGDINGINYTGEHYTMVIDSSGNSTKEDEYTNGSGMIYFKSDGYLYWQDNVEGSGDDCYFTKE